MEKEIENENPSADIGSKRKVEDFEKESNLDLLSAVSGEHRENILPCEGTTKISLPSLPSSFATIDSFCSSTNASATNVINEQLVFEGNFNFDFLGHSTRPAKRSRFETDMAQMRKDLDSVIKGMVMQNNMMMHMMLDFKTLREWLTTEVCPHLHINSPP
ncbi:hypothetical protein TSUD_179930 [Trifolium subterraneum]|uniref:Uncharacterized protein n=1 Tax=Trifolium subterraneum TaxID=3900 RepID=A0A2Z6PQV9_TRISU|nr:hypothetical protein TSUD_179930 [Trifolium subterraneum]